MRRFTLIAPEREPFVIDFDLPQDASPALLALEDMLAAEHCARCAGSDPARRCSLFRDCLGVMAFFNRLNSATDITVVFEAENQSQRFVTSTANACFMMILHCMFNSGCPFFAPFKFYTDIYNIHLTPSSVTHIIISTKLISKFVEDLSVDYEQVSAEIMQFNDKVKKMMVLLHENIKRVLPGETLGNAFQMLYSVNYLSSEHLRNCALDLARKFQIVRQGPDASAARP